MSHSVYGTPQSLSGKATRTPRRRALSPKSTPYASPFQIVDLDNDTVEDLKTKLLEAESIISELRADRDKWQEECVAGAGLNESVIIERSNKVSTQETRIYRRDVTVLEDDILQKQSKIRELQEKCAFLEMENKKLADKMKTSNFNREEETREMSNLKKRFHALEEQLLVETNEVAVLRNHLEAKNAEITDQRIKFETEMVNLQAKLVNLMEKVNSETAEKSEQDSEVQTLRKRIVSLETRLLAKENEQNQSQKLARKSAETENTQKVLSEVRQLSDRLEFLTPVRKTQNREHEEILQLSAKVIEENLSDLKRKNARLEKELLEKREVLKAREDELEALRKTMDAAMGDSEQATRYLQEENIKITRQKADIRCELIDARRQIEQFDKKRLELERQRDDALDDVRRIQKAKQAIEKELEAMKTSDEKRHEEVDKLKEELAGYDVIKRDYERTKGEVVKTQEKLSQIGKHLIMADNQCLHFKDLKEAAERSRRRAIEQCNELIARNRELEGLLESQRKMEFELDTLRGENERQTKKIEYMKEEIQEMHMDYREELAKMAAEEKNSKDQSEAVTNLRLIVSQKESELRRIQKTVEELKADNQRLQAMLDEERKNQKTPLDENVRLRKGMADALEKIEVYKRNWQTAQENLEAVEKEKSDKEHKLSQLEEELHEKSQQVTESEQVVSYLHSQINAKQIKQPKLGRKSTLLSTVSEMDTSVYIRESEEVQKLEDQRQELLRDLETKRRQLAEKKSHSTTDTTTITMETSTTVTQSSQSASQLSRTPAATMRHDIPHKWKEFRHLGVLSIKCSLCFSGIPTLGKARKCTHCDVHVHAACAPRVNNTCGMPVQCANYYRENYTGMSSSTVSEGRMNGWLRVYMDDHQGATWISSWAMMDLTRVSFYTNDGADLDKPFFSIDLNKEQWVLRTGQEMPVECDDSMRASNVLMIKMPRRCLYILAPSQPSARRWAECLQTAQRKRMMLNSRPASIAEFSCLLVLNQPNNLNIFKVRIIEDWYVFATQTGLFFTSITQPRNPCRIAGPSSVTFLEIMSDINCIAMVANGGGQLTLIPMDSLTLAMQSTQPSIRPQVLPEFTHVNGIRYHQQNGQRFLLVADDTHLHIRKYNSTKDVFSHFAKIAVPEPVTFIESAPHGVLFASDTFYFATIDPESTSSNVSLRSLIPARSADYPISAQLISDKEILLSFQNYGIFVGIDGKQTRKETIEWEKMPLEFAYTAPYLYVIHDDSIEILEIPEYSGPETKTALEERELFECVNAHIVGMQFDGVLISVSSNESTEVHRFSTFCGQSRKNISKRRGVSPSNTLKRSKN